MSCRLAPAAAPAIDVARAASVQVWLLRTPAWRSRLSALLRHVDAAQRRRCNSLRVARQRDDRLLAQALHRVVLAGALDQAPDEVPLYRAASGQPRLALPGLYTSLSHADGVIAIALSRGGPVGVDVEMPDRPSLRPIADLVCAPGEDIGDDETLLRHWVCKEAALKAAGTGLAQPMNAFRLAGRDELQLRDALGDRVAMQVHLYGDMRECIAAVAGPVGARPAWRWLEP